MKGVELLALYLLVGLGVALAAILRARVGGALDAGLLFAFWPLYGPFLLLGGPAAPVPEALDPGRSLGPRLEALGGRVEELDRLLAQPDFQIEAAEAKRAAHLERGEGRAAARVEARIASIRRLRARRAELVEGLSEAKELMAQLRVQAEVMRVAGGSGEETASLVEELECRVEGLDTLLALPEGEDLQGAA